MNTKPDFTSTEARPCRTCSGEGTRFSKGFTATDGTVYPDETRKCYSCDGQKTWPLPDYRAIATACIATRGKNKGSLRASPPFDPYGRGFAPFEWRAYYVWRLARFHGGADVTMPMTADMFCGNDPFRAELDAVAEMLARKIFGTDMAAAHRWASALGYSKSTPSGLPATAYEGGPVADGGKPDFELPELK